MLDYFFQNAKIARKAFSEIFGLMARQQTENAKIVKDKKCRIIFFKMLKLLEKAFSEIFGLMARQQTENTYVVRDKKYEKFKMMP